MNLIRERRKWRGGEMSTLTESTEKIFSMYKEDKHLSSFDILHIYPKELTRNIGIVHARFFEVVGYNRTSMTKMNLGRHDNIAKWDDQLPLREVQVFQDGSTILIFTRPVRLIASLAYTTATLFLK